MLKKRPILKTILVIVIFIAFLWIIKDPIFSHYFSKKMGHHMSVSRIGVTPSRITIDRLRIKNPSGFKLSSAFSSKNVRIDYSYSDLMQDPGYIDLMEFDDVFLSIECLDSSCTENNWTQLAHQKSGHQKGYMIDKVIFRNITIEVMKDGSVKKEKTIPIIELNNVNSDEGFPIQSLIKQVFQSAELNQYDQRFPKEIPGQDRRVIRRTLRRQHRYYDE